MSKIAFVFPGQGAQYVGMGKDFYEQIPVCKEIIDTASQVTGLDIPALCFEENENLNITEYTQVAMTTTCIAMYEALKEQECKWDVAAGLSLGEYSALYACGAFDLKDVLMCVRKRGIYMQEEVPLGEGSMSAVIGLDNNIIEDVCKNTDGVVSIANYNCPGQIVITGEKEAVKEAGAALLREGALRVVPLVVSGPFHSSMLKGAGKKLEVVLNNILWKKLQKPYVANVNAQYISDITKVKDLLVSQVSSSVKWQQSVQQMINQGVDEFIEIGPGKTLKKFIKKISKKVTIYNIETINDLWDWEKCKNETND